MYCARSYPPLPTGALGRYIAEQAVPSPPQVRPAVDDKRSRAVPTVTHVITATTTTEQCPLDQIRQDDNFSRTVAEFTNSLPSDLPPPTREGPPLSRLTIPVPPSNEIQMCFRLEPVLGELNRILGSIPGCRARYYLAGDCPAGWFFEMSVAPDIIACNTDHRGLPVLPIHVVVDVKTFWSVSPCDFAGVPVPREFLLVESFV
jgi:hypothetical protein